MKAISITRTKTNSLSLIATIIIFVFALAFSKSYAIDNPVDKTKSDKIETTDKFESLDVMPSFNVSDLSKVIKYPEKARKMGLQGRVILKVFVTKEGNPKEIEVLDTVDEIFNNAAIDALKQITFKPGIRKNNPVDTWVNIPIDFKLK